VTFGSEAPSHNRRASIIELAYVGLPSMVDPEEFAGMRTRYVKILSLPILEDATIRDATERYARLTSRERQVFALVTAGLMNKQVAFDLGLSEIRLQILRVPSDDTRRIRCRPKSQGPPNFISWTSVYGCELQRFLKTRYQNGRQRQRPRIAPWHVKI
jgi:hypothetical protein